MATYVKWSEADVRRTLEKCDFKEVRIGGTVELVFERKTKIPGVLIRVYSSVAAGAARNVGKDAGRVVLVAKNDNNLYIPIWKAKRVHRTQGFLENLKDRCREAYKAAGLIYNC